MELVRECEELAQQAIADERLGRIREQAVFAIEPDLGETLVRLETQRRRGRGPAGVAEDDLERVVEQQLVELRDRLALPLQVEPQFSRASVGELLTALAFELDPQGGGRSPRRAHPAGERRTDQLRVRHSDRPERHRIARPVFAGQVAHRLGAQAAVPVDREALGRSRPDCVELELHDRHRRDRRQVMRVEHAQQGGRQLGELVVDLVLDPTGQEGERLDQPLDVRIGAAVGLQQQPAGGGRILLGELLGELADERQLALVIVIQRLAHVTVRPAGSTSLPS